MRVAGRLTRIPRRLLAPLAILVLITLLFIGPDPIERRLFQGLSIGQRHALLTTWALGVAAGAGLIVYGLMARQQRRLAEKENMFAIGQIAAGIAHEVCNPLSSISSIVQVLRRAGSKPPDPEQLDLIERHVQRISEVIRRLTKLAHSAGETWRPTDVVEALEEVVRLIEFDLRARKVNVSLVHPEPLPRVYGVRRELQQAFLNLSLNAFDAMPDTGKLTLSVRRGNGNLQVRVTDTGRGIAPETRRHLFKPFFTTKGPGQGTGLGLAVSRSIIEKHGGTIDVYSTVGQGTEFIIQLPVMDEIADT